MIYNEIISNKGSKYPIEHLFEGDVLLSQGEEIQYINILVSGSVYISHISDEGERLITGLFDDAQFFGLIEVLNEKTYSYSSVIVLEKVEIIKISKQEFIKEMKTDIRLMNLVVEYLSSFAFEIINKNQRERSNSPKENILNFFYQSSLNKRFPVEVKTNREFLADLFGINIRTLFRYLNEWEEEGLIRREGQKIIIDKLAFERLKNYQ